MKKLISSIAAATLFSASGAVLADDWTFMGEFYGLGANIEGDAGAGFADNLNVDVPFSTILDTLSVGGMAHFEAQHSSGWGIALDWSMMDLEESIDPIQLGADRVQVAAGVRQQVSEGFIFKNISPSSQLFIGARAWNNNITADIENNVSGSKVSLREDQDWVDAIVGYRIVKPISKDWTLKGKFDVGGFGLESDWTGTIDVGAEYAFNETWALDLRLKGLWVDYDTGTRGEPGYFKYDTVTYGPIVGVIARF